MTTEPTRDWRPRLSDWQRPTAASPDPPQRVTFAAERAVKHAAVLFIVVTYIWLGLMALLVLLTIAGLGIL